MALAFQHLRIVLEPGGAVSLAAAVFHGDAIDGDAVVCVASGGNVDPPASPRQSPPHHHRAIPEPGPSKWPLHRPGNRTKRPPVSECSAAW